MAVLSNPSVPNCAFQRHIAYTLFMKYTLHSTLSLQCIKLPPRVKPTKHKPFKLISTSVYRWALLLACHEECYWKEKKHTYMYFYDVILTRKIVPYIRHGYYIKNKVVVFSTQLLELHCPFLAFWVKPRIEIETLKWKQLMVLISQKILRFGGMSGELFKLINRR